jgi:hypothetical protein
MYGWCYSRLIRWRDIDAAIIIMQLFVFLAPPFTYLYYLYMLLFSMSLFAFLPMLNMLFCPSFLTICTISHYSENAKLVYP